MSDIVVPELGESIVEATLLAWLKQEGEPVGQGEAVAELETDKVNVEVIADEAGALQSIRKKAGDTVKVGEVLGVVGPAGAGTGTSGQQGTSGVQPTVSEASAPAAVGTQASGETGSQSQGSSLPRATPAVRRFALEHGVDLSQVQGTGGQGRITEADVRNKGNSAAGTPAVPTAALQVIPQQPTPSQVSLGQSQAASRADEERTRMSRRRLTIAKRLVEAQHTAAMLTTFNEIDMTAVLDIRKRRKDRFKEENGVGLGFMSFFTKAVVGALKAFPRLNAEIQGEDMLLKYHYDIGIAVATDTGLVVPVVRAADGLSFAGIEREIASLAEKARTNALSVSDLQGGTFTITNGGVFGSLLSTPILNAPQVGILGMHTIQQRPVAVDGKMEIRPMMYIALSYDHRIVDGSEAVRFLVKVKQLIEDPESLLLEG